MRSQSLAVDLATTEGENLKSLARKTWAFWDLRVVSPGLRSCATRFWVWAMCFFHKFNTNLRKHHIFWWEQQVTRQNPWMMTASCQAYPAYLKKMPVLCAYFRMSNHQPSVIHELMIWESQNSFESSTFWICKLDDPKPALIHKLKSSTRMSYSNKFYCFFLRMVPPNFS